MSSFGENVRGRGRSDYNNEPSTSTGKRQREERVEGDNKRHAPENQRSSTRSRENNFQIIVTKPHQNPTRHTLANMSNVVPVVVEANYFALKSRTAHTEWRIYKYHVTFNPECLQLKFKIALISHHKNVIGGFLFDGAQLFATRKLHHEGDVVEFISEARDKTTYTIKMKFTRIVLMTEQESLQVLNLIQRLKMSGMKLDRVGRNFYDPQNMIDLSREFRIQLWPGYDTSIRSHENGILLNCDVAHKVMRTDTVYELMCSIRRNDPSNFENSFRQKVLGMTVLTSYLNKTYRIDDVDFGKSPSTTFSRNGTDMSIKQYYIEKYNTPIRDVGQPLLISQPKAKDLRGGQAKACWLVPELCRITGLDERHRNDINLKNALKPYTQMPPHIRRQRLIDFNNRMQNSEASARVANEFGLQAQRDLVQIDAYRILPRNIIFGDSKVTSAGWDRECGRGRLYTEEVTLNRWAVVFPRRMETTMKNFCRKLQEFSRAMNFMVEIPKMVGVDDDRQLVGKIQELANMGPKLIMAMTSTNSRNNSDLYSAIKKKCFVEHAIPCQVVTNFVLNAKSQSKYNSVVTKIGIQLYTKMGGAPWGMFFPLRNAMTIGFEVVKDSCNKNVSYACLVATMDLRTKFKFFTIVSKIEGSDCTKEVTMHVNKALNEYVALHESLPSTIFFYRGGVSDGDLLYVRDIEVQQLTDALRRRYDRENMPMKMAYIIVSKKINTRFFERNNGRVSNPEPGTVVDNTVTLNERYEFFLVSQKCNQGTIAPTNYNIIYDSTGIPPEHVQTWTFLQTHIYYNWYGTTRIPAVLQYCQKLGFLVANYMHRAPDEKLGDKLFFL